MSQDAFRSIVRSVLGIMFVSATALLEIQLPFGNSLMLCSFMTLAFVILAVVDRHWTALAGITAGALELALFLRGPGFALEQPLDALAIAVAFAVGLIVSWFARTQRTEICRLVDELRKTAASEQDTNQRLKEISHRVTNDFSMLVATASNIGRRSKSQETRSAMTQFSTRVVVLGRLYRRLGAAETGNRGVDLRSYFQELCDDLQLARFASEPINIQLEIDDIEMPLRSATLLGLITNELLTNVDKHAFPGNQNGLVSVALRRAPPGMLVLEVIDNGVGFNGPIAQRAGMGHRMLVSLAAQLHGAISFSRVDGKTIVTVSFPMNSPDGAEHQSVARTDRSRIRSPALAERYE